MTLTEQMTQLAKQAKAASRELSRLATGDKNACLLAMADALEQNSAAIQAAKSLGEYGVQIKDVELRTGMSAKEVGQFAFAAKAGSTAKPQGLTLKKVIY